MININLLPWRTQQREHDKKFLAIGACMAIGLAAAFTFSVHYIYSTQISQQRFSNRILQTEIDSIAPKLNQLQDAEKTALSLKQHLYEFNAIQYSRHQNIETLNIISNIAPKGVYLSSVKNTKKQLIVAGTANSNFLVSSLLKRIKLSGDFARATLNETEQNLAKNGPAVVKFTITADLVPLATQTKGVSA